MSENIQHSHITNSHYTVPEVVEAYREVAGSIDLDPFSCEDANQIVKATEYFSLDKGQNGFLENWYGNILTNPPGGFIHPSTFVQAKRGASSMALAFDKAESVYLSGRAKQILFVAFSLELITKRPSIFEYPLCFVNRKGLEKNPSIITGGGRLKYLNSEMQLQSSPTHGTFFVYMPLRNPESSHTDIPALTNFLDVFSQFGSTGYFG
jgi:hypothetical protein